MSSPRSRKAPPPPPRFQLRLRERWDALRGRITMPPPGRLALLGGLAAATVGTLALLAETVRGGFDRNGLQRLASQSDAVVPPARPAGYIRR